MTHKAAPMSPAEAMRKITVDVEAELTGQKEQRLADLRSGAAWAAFADSIRLMGDKMLASEFAQSDLERAEGFRYLMGMVLQRLQKTLYECGPELPTFVLGGDDIVKVALDNADGINSKAAKIRGDLTYRLYGRSGGERYVEFIQTGAKGTLSNHYLDQFALAPDGRFEIFLSPEKTSGNWMPLHPQATGIFVRQIQYDWVSEGNTELHIERPGITGVPDCLKLPEPAAVAAELRAVSKVLVSEMEYWFDYTRAFRVDGDNVIPWHLPLATSGHSAVRAAPKGFFVLEPNEALLLEFEPAVGNFWSVGLGDTWFRTIDPSHRQTSLNGHQAKIDSDGLCRVVIAHQDPGIANWLDTAGHRRGVMIFRFVRTETRPMPKITVAPLEKILADLPADTARITPADRQKIIAARARGYSKRYAEPLTSRWSRFE